MEGASPGSNATRARIFPGWPQVPVGRFFGRDLPNTISASALSDDRCRGVPVSTAHPGRHVGLTAGRGYGPRWVTDEAGHPVALVGCAGVSPSRRAVLGSAGPCWPGQATAVAAGRSRNRQVVLVAERPGALVGAPRSDGFWSRGDPRRRRHRLSHRRWSCATRATHQRQLQPLQRWPTDPPRPVPQPHLFRR